MTARIPGQDIKLLFDRTQIARRVAELGEEISRDYAGESVVLAGVLKGAAIFLADLARSLTIEATFDFVMASSYGNGRESTGEVKLLKGLETPIGGRHVILVEDILDSGRTAIFLRRMLEQQEPKSLKLVTFLDKPARRQQHIEADYIGFRIPDRFVVGYGMDYAELYRNRPEIYVLPHPPPEDENTPASLLQKLPSTKFP